MKGVKVSGREHVIGLNEKERGVVRGVKLVEMG